MRIEHQGIANVRERLYTMKANGGDFVHWSPVALFRPSRLFLWGLSDLAGIRGFSLGNVEQMVEYDDLKTLHDARMFRCSCSVEEAQTMVNQNVFGMWCVDNHVPFLLLPSVRCDQRMVVHGIHGVQEVGLFGVEPA